MGSHSKNQVLGVLTTLELSFCILICWSSPLPPMLGLSLLVYPHRHSVLPQFPLGTYKTLLYLQIYSVSIL